MTTTSTCSSADDGPGIPADKIERVFEAYYTTKERRPRVCKGLAIVKHNVELYGGEVRVESGLEKERNSRYYSRPKTLM